MQINAICRYLIFISYTPLSHISYYHIIYITFILETFKKLKPRRFEENFERVKKKIHEMFDFGKLDIGIKSFNFSFLTGGF